MTLSAGEKLGPYGIHSAVSAGGMGEVYRAREIGLGGDVRDERFLMLKIGDGDAGTTTPDHLIVVQNWFEELKRRVPSN